MTSDVIRLYYDYNGWATERILAAAEGMLPEQLEIPGHAGHGSVRETLIHMIETQWSWFSWFDGSLPVEKAYGMTIDRDSVHDIPAIRRTWLDIDAQATRLVERLSDDELSAEWPLGMPGGPSTPVPLWKLMLHVANHGTQHRSEVAAMLTEHGRSPGGLDMLYYTMAQSAPAS
ncbi:MAG TPA: DinB family protein [Thermomicrobiales bacterium]|nr:DinB family protein [Thermomicrobiales bacterium]